MVYKIIHIIDGFIIVLLAVIILLNIFGLIVLGVVEGPSMEPLFQTGDLIIIVKSNDIKVGDIIVYKKKGGYGFIIHRVIEIHSTSNELYYVTKGDNNSLPDYQEFELMGVPSYRVIGKVLEINNLPVKIPGIGYLPLIVHKLFSYLKA